MSYLEKISIVGLGPGNKEYITKKGIENIQNCDIAIGGKRQLEDVITLLKENCETYTLGKLTDVIEYIKSNRTKKITVIVSGDTGYYSLLPFLQKYFLKEELEIIPGISSFQYLFSKLGEVWHNYRLMSVHGRDMDYIKELNENSGIVLLTDDKNTPYTIAKKIYEQGHRNMEVIVGERLSYEDEKITVIDLEKYIELNREFKMNITVIRKK